MGGNDRDGEWRMEENSSTELLLFLRSLRPPQKRQLFDESEGMRRNEAVVLGF